LSLNFLQVLSDHLGLGSVRSFLGHDLLNATISGFGEDMSCSRKTERHHVLTSPSNFGLAL